MANSMAIASPWAVSSEAEADPREMEQSVISCLVRVVPDIGFMPSFWEEDLQPTVSPHPAGKRAKYFDHYYLLVVSYLSFD